MAEAALRLQGLDQLLVGQVLMGLRAQRRLLDLAQQIAERLLAADLGTQDLGVDEQADQALGFQAVAVGRRHADADVALAAVAVQQHLERPQQEHERRHPFALCKFSHCSAQRCADRHIEARAAIALAQRTRMIGGQLQYWVGSAKRLSPVSQLALTLAGGHPLALPAGIVAVLDRQRRQLRVLALAEGRIQRQQFLDQQGHRPAIADHMVQGHQQQMIVSAEAHQPHPPQRAGGEVERLRQLGGNTLFGGSLALRFGQRALLQVQNRLGAFVQALLQAVADLDEGRAQTRLAFGQGAQAALQRLDLQRPAQAQRRRNVVGTPLWLQLPEEPLALLGEGHRRRPAVAGGNDRQPGDTDAHLLQAGEQLLALVAVQALDAGEQFLGACGAVLKHCFPPVRRARRKSGRAPPPGRHRTWCCVSRWPGLRSGEGPGNP
ncbi:hypothetical protein D3C81_970540 [compost metagenome]